jgi:hypothetical protein
MAFSKDRVCVGSEEAERGCLLAHEDPAEGNAHEFGVVVFGEVAGAGGAAFCRLIVAGLTFLLRGCWG